MQVVKKTTVVERRTQTTYEIRSNNNRTFFLPEGNVIHIGFWDVATEMPIFADIIQHDNRIETNYELSPTVVLRITTEQTELVEAV